MENYELLYEQSRALIKAYPTLTTSQIPNNLLEVWHNNEEITPYPDAKQAFAVMIYKMASERYGARLHTPSDDHHRYLVYQYILATEHLCRQLKVVFKPKQIFNFADYDQPLNITLSSKQLARYKKAAKRYIHLIGKV